MAGVKPQTPRFKAVLFDIDGTLLSLGPIYSAVRKACKRLGLRALPRKDISKNLIGYKIQDSFPKLFPREPAKKRYVFRDVFYEEYSKIKSRALPGAKETVRKLRQAGVKVGIVTTKGSPIAAPSLRSAGISYDALLSGDDVNRPKPNPGQINKAMKRLKVGKKGTLVVGDHTFDIMAGIKAGCMTAGVTTGVKSRAELKKAGADWVIGSLKAIPGIAGLA